ncbi:MAG: S1-C subfamily serine protease [Kiritimatiellia bacterium]|jgi:S1-C subfamily serine protease
MKIKQPFLTIAALILSALLSFTVFGKGEFDQDKFSELLMKEAAENNGLLALEMETIKDLLIEAGMDPKEAKQISPLELAEKLLPGGLGLGGGPGMMGMTEEDFAALDTQFNGLLEGHRPAIKNARKSTVAFFKGEAQVALGTVVDANGLILTKASEARLAGKYLEVEIKGDRYSASVLKTFDDYDLALVKVPAKGLTPAAFYTGDQPDIGAFLTAPGASGDDPIAIGVLSVHSRSLDGSDRGFLGVQLAPADVGVRVGDIVPGTAAVEAGILRGDLIVQLDGQAYNSVPEFIAAVGKHHPGDKLHFKIKRGDEEKDYEIALGTRPKMDLGPGRQDRFDRMNLMGGPLSETRDDFPMALQHDMPLDPAQCGGPVVDLDGHVLGINIARAGRVKTYAIPSDKIAELLNEVNTVELVKNHAAEEKELESTRLKSAHDSAMAELKKAEERLEAARKKAADTKRKLEAVEN